MRHEQLKFRVLEDIMIKFSHCYHCYRIYFITFKIKRKMTERAAEVSFRSLYSRRSHSQHADKNGKFLFAIY